jgi:hypothetical protein
VGTSPNHWHLAPFNDPSWDIWCMSRLFQDPRCTRWNVWFELHHTDDLCGSRGKPDDAQESLSRRVYLEWLQRQEGQIYIRDKTPLIPNGTRYPIEEVLKVFPRGYFTNTVSYAIALAICFQPEEIGLWGVDMALSEEYQHQRPSVEYFCGLAEGAGIKLTLPPETTLLKTAQLYALVDDPPIKGVLVGKRKELEGRSKMLQHQFETAQMQNAALRGAIDMLNFFEENLDFATSDTLPKMKSEEVTRQAAYQAQAEAYAP